MEKFYQITTNKNEYNRKIKLMDLFIENKLDITKIKFSNPSAKFKISLDEVSICQLGGLGMGLFPKNFDISTNYEIIENDLNPYTTPNVLDVFVDLSSFYDDPTPSDFDNSPRISPKFIAIYFYSEILKAN